LLVVGRTCAKDFSFFPPLGKLISGRQRQKLFKGSSLQAVDSPYFLGEANCKPSMAKTFRGKPIASRQQQKLFEESEL